MTPTRWSRRWRRTRRRRRTKRTNRIPERSQRARRNQLTIREHVLQYFAEPGIKSKAFCWGYICFKCQKAACCFQTFMSYKTWLQHCNKKTWTHTWLNFMYVCHTSKPLDTQMAFSLGSQIAVSSRNQVDGCQWKLLIFRDCGVRKKTKTAWSWGVMQWSFNHLFSHSQFPKTTQGECDFKCIYICTYTPYISIFIPFYLFLPGPAPGHAVRGFSQRIGDGVQCSNGFDVQWVDLWISQCRTWPQAHTTWTCMFLFKPNHIKTYHEWWAVDQTSFMKHDSDESPYDELWELLTCQGEESWL